MESRSTIPVDDQSSGYGIQRSSLLVCSIDDLANVIFVLLELTSLLFLPSYHTRMWIQSRPRALLSIYSVTRLSNAFYTYPRSYLPPIHHVLVCHMRIVVLISTQYVSCFGEIRINKLGLSFAPWLDIAFERLRIHHNSFGILI